MPEFRFVQGGCRVALLARSIEYVETLASELNNRHTPSTALPIECDLGDAKQITAAFAKIREAAG